MPDRPWDSPFCHSPSSPRLHRPPPTTRLILHPPRHKELSSSPGIIAALRGILRMEFPRSQGDAPGILRTGVRRIRSLQDLSFFFFSFLDFRIVDSPLAFLFLPRSVSRFWKDLRENLCLNNSQFFGIQTDEFIFFFLSFNLSRDFIVWKKLEIVLYLSVYVLVIFFCFLRNVSLFLRYVFIFVLLCIFFFFFFVFNEFLF